MLLAKENIDVVVTQPMIRRVTGRTQKRAGGEPALSVVKTRYFCHCIMEDGSETYIVAKATSEAEASKKVHRGYTVEYVLDVLTQHQMERRKGHLKPSLLASTRIM